MDKQSERQPPGFSDHAPVYLQLSQLLRERVGVEWRAGDTLPSEGALAEAYSVNRITMRRAVSLLVEEGLLQRRRGAAPVVGRVSAPVQPKLEADPSSLFKARPGTRFKVVRYDLVSLPPDAIDQLELEPNAQGYRVDRVLEEQGKDLAYVLAYVPERLGHLLDVAGMDAAPLSAQLTRHGVRITTAEHYVEAVLADVLVAPALSIPMGSAILKCRYVLRDEKRAPVLVASYFYRADRYRLALEISTSSIGGGARVDAWPMRVIVNQQ